MRPITQVEGDQAVPKVTESLESRPDEVAKKASRRNGGRRMRLVGRLAISTRRLPANWYIAALARVAPDLACFGVVEERIEGPSRDCLLDSFPLPFKALSTEKENGAVLHLHHIDLRCLALDNRRLLALLSPESDNDLFANGKRCHKNHPW